MGGADEAFAADLRHSIARVYALAARLCATPEDAQELAQDTLLRAWEKRAQLADSGSLFPWLRRICVNRFLEQSRNLKNGPRSVGSGLDELGAEGQIEPSEERDLLPDEALIVDESVREIKDFCFAAMIAHLSCAQRAVFALVETFGLGVSEAAEALDCSLSAAKALLFRARRNIVGYFEEHCSLFDVGKKCACGIWKEFIHDRERLKAEIKNRGMEARFDERISPRNSETTRARHILAAFKDIPPRQPDQCWYERVVALIKR